MSCVRVQASRLSGKLKVPPSKSQTLRALLFASLGKGVSIIRNALDSPDTDAMVAACKSIGAKIEKTDDVYIVEGCNGRIKGASDVIYAGNSGIVYRFLGGIACLGTSPIVVTGDESIRDNRPIFPLLSGLIQWGVKAHSLSPHGYGAPIYVHGPILGTMAIVDGEDSQPISALLIAGVLSERPLELFVSNPGELPWVDLTLSWFDRLGLPYQREGYSYYSMKKKGKISAFEYTVPGDFSSAAFPLAAALVTQSKLTLEGLDFQDHQGDKKLLGILKEMGAHLEIDEENGCIHVFPSRFLRGISIQANDCIDAVPILAVLGCFAQGETYIKDIAGARNKESDRLDAITQELSKMGASIEEFSDHLVVRESRLKGGKVNSHKDHRIAMALAVAGLGAKRETTIKNSDCIKKTYPCFIQDLAALGGKIV